MRTFIPLLFISFFLSCKSDTSTKQDASPKKDKFESNFTYEQSHEINWEINQKGVGPIKNGMSINKIPPKMLIPEGGGTLKSYKILNNNLSWICNLVANESDGLVKGIFIYNNKSQTKEGIGVGSTYAEFRKQYSDFDSGGHLFSQKGSMRIGKIVFETDFDWDEPILLKNMIPEDAKIIEIWIDD